MYRLAKINLFAFLFAIVTTATGCGDKSKGTIEPEKYTPQPKTLPTGAGGDAGKPAKNGKANKGNGSEGTAQ